MKTQKTAQIPSYCAAPWVEGILYANGEMKPCCLSVSVLGNWQKKGLSEVWHSELYQGFRKKIIEGRFPEDNCRRCCNNHYNRNLGWGLGSSFKIYLTEVETYWEKNFSDIHDLSNLFSISPNDNNRDVWQPLLLRYDSAVNRLALLGRDATEAVQFAVNKLGVIGLVVRSFFEQSLTPPILAPHREVQLIARCNARCVQCLGTHTGISADGPVMQDEFLPEAFAQSEDIVNFFNNGSEFLLYKGWKEVASMLAQTGSRISLSTNSILLTPGNIEYLVDNRLLLSANISIDGATKKTVEKIRVNVNFDNMMRGVDYLCKYATQENYFFPIGFSFVVMKENCHELPELVRLIESFKNKYPGFHYSIGAQMLVLTDVAGYREFVHAQHPGLLGQEKINTIFGETLSESKRTGVVVSFLNSTIEEFVENGCRIPKLLDPLMFLEKGEDINENFTMRMGLGWYPVEIAPMPARWLNDRAEVLISSENEQECVLHLTISSFHEPRVCRIMYAGKVLFEQEVGTVSEVVSVPLSLKKGEGVVEIKSLDGAEAPVNIEELQSLDDRKLAFHVRGVEVVI